MNLNNHLDKDYEIKVAKKILDHIESFLKKKKRLNICLSGGSTPIKTLIKLSTFNIDWSRIDFFLTDERTVSNKSKNSNFYNLKKALIKIQKLNLHKFYDDISIDSSIKNYEKLIKSKLSDLPQKSFDILILGFGADGHIASIFPDIQLNKECKSIIFKYQNTNINFKRISLSMKLLVSSEKTFILSYGKKKFELMKSNNYNNPIKFFIQNNQNYEWYYTKKI